MTWVLSRTHLQTRSSFGEGRKKDTRCWASSHYPIVLFFRTSAKLYSSVSLRCRSAWQNDKSGWCTSELLWQSIARHKAFALRCRELDPLGSLLDLESSASVTIMFLCAWPAPLCFCSARFCKSSKRPQSSRPSQRRGSRSLVRSTHFSDSILCSAFFFCSHLAHSPHHQQSWGEGAMPRRLRSVSEPSTKNQISSISTSIRCLLSRMVANTSSCPVAAKDSQQSHSQPVSTLCFIFAGHRLALAVKLCTTRCRSNLLQSISPPEPSPSCLCRTVISSISLLNRMFEESGSFARFVHHLCFSHLFYFVALAQHDLTATSQYESASSMTPSERSRQLASKSVSLQKHHIVQAVSAFALHMPGNSTDQSLDIGDYRNATIQALVGSPTFTTSPEECGQAPQVLIGGMEITSASTSALETRPLMT